MLLLTIFTTIFVDFVIFTSLEKNIISMLNLNLMLNINVTFNGSKHFCLKDELLCKSHRKPALRLLKRRDSTCHDGDVCVFSRCFPWCPHVNLNPLIVCNHMDAVLMCCDSDCVPPNILESDKVIFVLNYIITIEWNGSFLTPSIAGVEAVSGESSLGLGQEGCPSQGFTFITNTL